MRRAEGVQKFSSVTSVCSARKRYHPSSVIATVPTIDLAVSASPPTQFERSAVTDEHSLPALEASHIQPYASEGPHEIRNGVLLRADLHRLFDTGYATVTPDLRLEISARLREDYQNGRSYYPLHGGRLKVPTAALHRPDKTFLEWHNAYVFRG